LVLQRIGDRSRQKPRHVLIDVGVLAPQSRHGHDYGRLHGAQTIRDLLQADRGALGLG
jgi:hypothetical protein